MKHIQDFSLNELSTQLLDVAARMRRLALSPEVAVPTSEVAMAKSLYRLRRKRDELLGADLFSDPAWDILLDLYSRQGKGDGFPVSAVCIGAASPSTTALRHIQILEERGLLLRAPDPKDRRRMFIRLSPKGRDAMRRLLRAV